MTLIPERRAPGAPNVAKCLGDAVDAGRLTREQAEKVLATVRRMMTEEKLPEDAAAAAAAKRLQEDAARNRRQAALQILAADRRLKEAAGHEKGMAAGVAAVFARDLWGRAKYSNVEGKTMAVRAELHAHFAAGMDAFRNRALGLRSDIIGPQNMVRELYGETTGDATAATAAREWVNTTEYAVRRFNRAGGDLRRKETWRLPQEWDSAKVKAAGREAFEEYMHAAVADGRLRIVDWETGEAVNALRQAEIISEAWATISSDGLNKFVPGQPRHTKLANARQERRAFDWQNADAWLDANERFGAGNGRIYDLLTGHISGMARDIAMLEVLGPNPEAMARLLIDHARKAGTGETRAHFLESLWAQVNGTAMSPVNELAATVGRGTRAVLSSAQLGGAMLSSITDFGTMAMTAAWNGLSARSTMGRYLSLMNPRNAADRRMAARLGLLTDGAAQRAVGAMRNQMEIVGNDLPGRFADFVMRASGLSAHTQAGKWALGMEFLGNLAEQAGRKLDQLSPELRRAFDAYGLGAAEWDIIRAAPRFEEGGVRFVWPERIAGLGHREQQVATRLLEMVQNEQLYAMLEPGALERTIALGGSRPGTAGGEIRRSFAQYKSWPLTMMTRHLMRGLDAYRGGDAGRYMAALAVSLTALGALAVQAKQIAAGRDLRDMNDARFWGAAFQQGGGAGILGDFLYSSLSRAEGSFFLTVVGGPTGGLVDDLVRLTGHNITATAEGADAHFGAEFARFVRRNTPGTSLWYTRLAMDRLMWDRLQELVDDDYRARFRRMENRARRETGQGFWWRPGAAAPERAPEIATAP